MDKLTLRIGVGDTLPKQVGYVNTDIRDLPNIDVVCDAKSMPFEDEKFDRLESRNLVEHFGRHEIDDLFKEWARVLKKGGHAYITTIDMGALMDCWRYIPEENMLDGILGAQTYPENFHKMAFTKDILERKLKEAGFRIGHSYLFLNRDIPRITTDAIKT